jgi:hypothetical protein
MARWYAARYEHIKAARKATQALSALRKLVQFERAQVTTNPCTQCPAAQKPCLKGGAA